MPADYVESLEKQPFESFSPGFDFAADLDSSETISSATVTAIDLDDRNPASTLILSGSPQIQNGDQSNSVVVQRVNSGISGKRYKIAFKVTTSDGNGFQANINLTVKEQN